MTNLNSASQQHGDPDGKKRLAKHAAIPLERIQYLADSVPSIISQIERGILFNMAFWSVWSIKAFRKLTETIKQIDEASILEVIVIDADGAAAFEDFPEFKDRLRGYGETAWIKDGRILSTSGLGYNPDCFAANTSALLAMP